MKEQPNLRNAYENEQAEIDSNSTSIAGLVRQLTREVPSLFTKELALAKAEISEALTATKAGAISMASGGIVLLAGFIILLLSAVLGLSQVVEPWLAALIVGGVVVVIGLVMVSAGKKKLEPASFKPERTINSMQKDKEAVKGKVA
ncbi:putative superfamily III holin-X [Pseudomonas duriflava]|uniref:Putative superfamily III holin-X n=1 Tax=Pseudomonas duriflava TaxID=459528 RepID=A0A562Q2R6_9PSED|nr:phage holin family protein [Pseudomonas duriflava]TWI50954.1 putative superfamily III holin-X [Pseudomonas duriflava]